MTEPTLTPDRLKLNLSFDPSRLEKDLRNLESDTWMKHFVVENYEGDWSVVPLHGPAGATHPVDMMYANPTCTEFEETPFLRSSPYFQEVLNSFKCPLQMVRLMKLTPGSLIKEHRDHELSIEEGTVRLHIPVITHDQIDFRLNQTPVVMKPGECWYLRLSDPHSVHNPGPTDRVHMVLDMTVNDWVRNLIH